MSDTDDDRALNPEEPSTFSRDVGRRLRAVRRARGLSLDEVERQSGGLWSSSAVGAYERGFRNLSLPRLRELAQFYNVPMSVLLGEVSVPGRTVEPDRRLVLDLGALEGTTEAGPALRFLRTIIHERGDYNGRILTVRREDARALCAVLQLDEVDLFAQLEEWGALWTGESEGEERLSQ